MPSFPGCSNQVAQNLFHLRETVDYRPRRGEIAVASQHFGIEFRRAAYSPGNSWFIEAWPFFTYARQDWLCALKSQKGDRERRPSRLNLTIALADVESA